MLLCQMPTTPDPFKVPKGFFLFFFFHDDNFLIEWKVLKTFNVKINKASKTRAAST